jgi:DNA-binding response OmpR family regulator
MQKRVLVVDDHPPTLRLITNALKGKGVDVATARNGAECLLAIENQRPVMDGFQTLRVIRENQATRTLPVIILSIRSEDEAVMKGLSGGADIYITKPFKMADLVTAVMRILLVTDGT